MSAATLDISVPAARHSDPSTSHAGARDIVIRAGSQQYRFLCAFSDGDGLTADEARIRAGVSIRASYWKRLSELRSAGLIEDTGETREGEAGSAQMVCRITAAGLECLRGLGL